MTAHREPGRLAGETALVLRTCAADMTSHGGFVWPGVGETAVAPVWNAVAECGNGLHGWLYGAGDHSASDSIGSSDAKWLIVEVKSACIVQLEGKCKFPRALVRFVGSRKSATDYLLAHEPQARGLAVIGAVLTVGDNEAGQVGACGQVSGGDRATVSGGDRATVSGGEGAELLVRIWDDKYGRFRTKVGAVGEAGIKPNVVYRLNAAGEFVEVQP